MIDWTEKCSVCEGAHAVCVFGGGSIGCITPDCQNPHHRNR